MVFQKKIIVFLNKLKRQRDIYRKDVYETTLLEKVDLDVKSIKKARGKAKKD